MFEHFTQKAIKVIMLAQEEARRLGHNFVGTEKILLGLIGEGTGIAGTTLNSMGVNLRNARLEVEKIIGRGSGFVAVEIPFTPRAKRVLELCLKESRKQGVKYIGTEHLLLGLIQVQGGVAITVLENMEINLQDLRDRLIRNMSELSDAQGNDIDDAAGRKLSKLVTKIDQLIEILADALREATEMSDRIKSELRERRTFSNDLTSAIAQLPNSPELDKPGIKELLTQLQAAIEADSNLKPDDKAEAFEQLVVLAEVADSLSDERMQRFARTGFKILKGTVAELPPTSELLQECNWILPAIRCAITDARSD
jgi:hypothetical protein